jgi:NADP-dependent 3-hydroxy acid dehydrogenase YdfG
VGSSGSLAGRVAVITGASSGIGEQTARELARQGAAVALLARRAERLEAIAADIASAGGRAITCSVDVTDTAALKEAASRVRSELGPTGIVFNNAGIMLPTPISDSSAEASDRQIALNIVGLNNTVRAFADQLISSAAHAGVADLVNTASIAAKTVFPTFSVYAASKAYVVHYGNTLRAELGPKNVRVTTIEPGIVETELQSHIDDERVRARLQGTRQAIDWLKAEDVAALVAFVVAQPARVNLAEVAILPTRQVA